MDWLNDNTGAIQAVATLVLVAVTVAYVIVTNWLVQEARSQSRPYVYIDVVNNTGFLERHIRNAGVRAATAVRFEIHQDVPIGGEPERGVLTTPLLERPIPYLAPGRLITETVGHFSSLRSHFKALAPEKRILSYQVKYQDGKKEYKEDLELDLSLLFGVERPFPEPNTYTAVGELRDNLTTALNRTGDILSGMAETLRDRPRQ